MKCNSRRLKTGWFIAGVAVASSLLAFNIASGADTAPQQAKAADPENAQWTLTLVGFFPGESKKSAEPKRLNCYLVRRNGIWVSGLATPTNNGRPIWNTAIMLVEVEKSSFRDNHLTATLSVTLVPDPWVPKDQKPRRATIEIDATTKPASETADGKSFAAVSGTWKSAVAGEADELQAAGLQSAGTGEIVGSVGPIQQAALDDESYELAFYNLIPGATADNFQRRRAISLGVKGGEIVSARIGQMDLRHNAFDFEEFVTPRDFTVKPDTFSGKLAFDTATLDGNRAQFRVSIAGRRVAMFLSGSWKGTVTTEDGASREAEGFFRGNVRPGAFVSNQIRSDLPWYVDVKGFQPPKPGEHPRLFFRKSDLPELRHRAETAEGKQIVKRLRELLNGSDGETMPVVYNSAKQAYEKNNFKERPGTFTISHAAGYGFLHQLTGDRKYADLARECLEKSWDGQRSGDDRYAWVAPGGELRAGPSLGWHAVAYDLCYDAWPDDFRKKVALAIQDYADVKGGEWNNPEGITLRKMVLTPKQGPGSNHFGAVVGGCGLAVLAIASDPGTDEALVKKYVSVLERQVVRHLSAGWGDGGYYREGWGASRVGTEGGFLCFLQALRVAQGHDYLNADRPNASFVTMVPRSLLLLGSGERTYFPYRSNLGPTYGNPEIGAASENSGLSHGGYFSEGFGAIADRYKPALLWTYNHQFDPANRLNYDTLGSYPHRAMLALINWPTFTKISEANPKEVMPLVVRDHLYDHIALRNGFREDSKDIVTTVLINYPDGTKPRDVMVWGLGGLRLSFGEPKRAPVTHFLAAADGSASVAVGDWAMAVDYSGSSAADALIVTVGGTPPKGDFKTDKARQSSFTIGGTPWNVLTLEHDGKHPEPKVVGNRLTVGDQVIELVDGSLRMSKFEASK